jgi:hypothetical protein
VPDCSVTQWLKVGKSWNFKILTTKGINGFFDLMRISGLIRGKIKYLLNFFKNFFKCMGRCGISGYPNTPQWPVIQIIHIDLYEKKKSMMFSLHPVLVLNPPNNWKRTVSTGTKTHRVAYLAGS